MSVELEMPGFFKDADAASLNGQRRYLALNRIRLSGAVIGALGGIVSLSTGTLDISALVALAGFLVALITELILAYLQPERDWYAGRSLAESMKTMAWRYAVQGAPFTAGLSEAKLHELLRARARQLTEKGADRIAIETENPLVTDSMSALRESDFEHRKAVYLRERTGAQRHWYAEKARYNRRRAEYWRTMLVSAEIIAVALATLRLAGPLPVNLGGVLGSVISASAAWLVLKQHSQLASAYSTTSRELAIQEDILQGTNEAEWARAVSDAEEAISREHTMWVATRSA
ncbi:DUF4231 domain-containing protein [Arthrobacter sp. MI7-26]|uniref:DUF4231 domain-containing protein n=1 Tax=Arthrobacter sp. MI7-26 TaxID=2993653 RepID=UPI002248ADE6|nr:DUF4231 domain-containing protein [Arthrobacter sp. MI7-26]MCX2748616.1 DUF4231 domain-containing protein [Arthrobacter sp. MI7-26]